MTDPIKDAIYQLRRHRGLARVGEPHTENDTTALEVDVAVELPSRCRRSGISASGVHGIETCFLIFGKDWPLSAPRVFLREDFPLNLPHINPHAPGQRVSPCLFEGSLDEVLHRFGLDAIIDQLINWLHHAAAGTLIDLSQGWEPARRDSSPSSIVFNAEQVAAAVPADGSLLIVNAGYITIAESVHAILDSSLTPLQDPVFEQTAHEDQIGKWGGGRVATYIARAPELSGEPQVFDEYQPETVCDLPSLLARADGLGVDAKALAAALESYSGNSILRAAQDPRHAWPHGLFVIVILAACRPASLIGSDGRNIELLPYVVHYEFNNENPLDRQANVHSAFHVHTLSPALLARTSGLPQEASNKPIVMLGCGSLGSKIALHLGRAGFGRITFVDKEFMSPHNVARHALINKHSVFVPPHKAELMKIAFEELSHTQASAFNIDATIALTDPSQFRETVPEDAFIIVDTTASLKVLASETVSVALDKSAARLIRAVLYGQGRCAVVFLEGGGRSSRVDDLTAGLFERCRFDLALRVSIVGDNSELTRIFVGDNCRSLTMPMPDATVSRAAALTGMQLERWLVDGLPEDSQICIGVADAKGVGMSWGCTTVAPTTVLDVAEDGGWKVRVLHTVVRAINTDVRQWTPQETGGALLGRISYENRTITIAGIVDAPPDSIREPARFVLGTSGLIQGLRDAHETSVGYLTFIGTWHSHPGGGPHSGIDRATLHHIAEEAGGLPVVSLVWTPDGLICAVERW